jgi:hypothetical protein
VFWSGGACGCGACELALRSQMLNSSVRYARLMICQCPSRSIQRYGSSVVAGWDALPHVDGRVERPGASALRRAPDGVCPLAHQIPALVVVVPYRSWIIHYTRRMAGGRRWLFSRQLLIEQPELL